MSMGYQQELVTMKRVIEWNYRDCGKIEVGLGLNEQWTSGDSECIQPVTEGWLSRGGET